MKILHFHADIEAVAACGIPGEGALHSTQPCGTGTDSGAPQGGGRQLQEDAEARS